MINMIVIYNISSRVQTFYIPDSPLNVNTRRLQFLLSVIKFQETQLWRQTH